MKLRRLEIRKWRALAEPVVLEFHDGINVVLGRNGTGKSNLLDLLARVTAMRFDPEPTDLTAVFDGADGARIELEVSGDEGHFVILGPPDPDETAPDFRFGEALDGWARITGEADQSATLTAPHVASPGRNEFPGAFFVPDVVTSALGRTWSAQSMRDWAVESPQSALLRAYASLVGAERVSLHAKLARIDDGKPRYEGFDVFVRYDDRTEVSGQYLSFGEKRLLAFLWHTGVVPADGVVVADELTNGMHHAWLSACIDAIGDRQAFVALQNPLLLDYLAFDSAEDVRRSFVLCDHAPRGSHGRWRWRQLDASGADELFGSWMAGRELLSEILISHGVW
ncbi:MAG: AAA family ATPase [Myxococcota bacterium]